MLEAGTFDLGFLVQGLRVVGAEGLTADVALLGNPLLLDHLSPILLVLVPLAPLWLFPYVLVVTQTAAIAGAGWLLWKIARRRSDRSPLVPLAAFLVAPIVVFAALSDFHASVLAIPFLILFFDGLETDHRARAAIGGSLGALCREDIALLVLVGCLIWSRRTRVWVIPGLVAAAVLSTFVALGAEQGWFLRSGLAYLDGASLWALPVEIWDRGLLIPVLGLIAMPWLFLGRVPSGRWLAVATVFVLPLLALDLPMLDHVGGHYFAPVAVPLALGDLAARRVFEGRVLLVSVLLAAFAVGPFGTAWAGQRESSIPVIVAGAVERRVEISALREWIRSLDLGDSVAVADPLTPWVEAGTVHLWPAPFADVVLPLISPIPIVTRGDPSGITDVVAPVHASHLGPDAGSLGLEEAGFRLVESSPDGRLEWWALHR